MNPYYYEMAELVGKIALVVLALYLIFLILTYVLSSISLFKVGKRRGVRLYGLAWVPVAKKWVLGELADAHDGRSGMDHKWRHVLLWQAVIVFVCCAVCTAFYGWIISEILSNPVMDLDDLAYVILDGIGSWSFVIRPAFILFSLLSTAFTVCNYICVYKFYESCRPRSTVLFLLIGLIFSVTFPFFMFACRDWDNGVNIKFRKDSLPIPEQDHTEES